MKKNSFRKVLLVVLFLCIPVIAVKGFRFYEKNYYRPDVTVMGFADMTDGLGRQSVELIHTLCKDFSVRFRQTRPHRILDDVPLVVQKIITKRSSPLGKVVIYEDGFFPETSRKFFEKRFKKDDLNQIRIAYSMLESTLIPTEWRDNLNDFFDAVVVPDPFLIEVYQNSGVNIPIFCLPLGLDLKPFLSAPLKQIRQKPMVFANFGTCSTRKNHVELVKAFNQAFGNSSDVKLLINCKYSSRKEIYDELVKTIQDLHVDNIILTTNSYSKEDYLQLFQSIDCYVSLSKSEGFSIQPREAMALGIPTIVSDNTAQTTISQTGLVISVPCPFREPAYYEIWDQTWGERFNIDPDHAVAAFTKMYEDYDLYLSQGEKARCWASQYDYSQIGSCYKTLVKPEKIVFSQENRIEKGMLYTHSKSLITRYSHLYPTISIEGL